MSLPSALLLIVGAVFMLIGFWTPGINQERLASLILGGILFGIGLSTGLQHGPL